MFLLLYAILPLMRQTSPYSPISSRDNSIIKYLRSLADPKHRKKEQAFLIEGIKMVEEALRDDLGVKTVVAAPSLIQRHGKGVLKLSESKGINIIWVTERLMDVLADSKTPQPVMAVVQMKLDTEESLLNHEARLIVVAHQLQDPGNLGTIIRTAEAAGTSGIAITSNTVDPFNAKAVRASMNSILRLPVVPVGDVAAFIQKCRLAGFQTIATALNGDKTHFAIDLTKPTAVIVGQEGAGLPPGIMAAIDLRVRIPMAEAIDSLNVATAAAVVLYEAMRQRLHDCQ
ncbi:MAG TPA: RNA methyltransferase [Nitrospirota bacterium]|nr:RNA methyltransferase [Nitrospirota bacterium]